MTMRRPTLAVWAVSMCIVGVAQLYRSNVEQIVGLVYIIGALVLAAGTIIRSRHVAAYGLGVIFAGAASRSGAAFILDTDWHGKAIIVAAWGLFAMLSIQEARRVIRDEQ